MKKHFILLTLLSSLLLTSCGNNAEEYHFTFYDYVHKSLVWSESFTLNFDKCVEQFPDSIEVYFRGNNIIPDGIDSDGTIIYKEGIADFHFHYDTKESTQYGPTYVNKTVVSATLDNEPFVDTYGIVESWLRSLNPIESMNAPYYVVRNYAGGNFVLSDTETENYIDYYYTFFPQTATERPGQYILSSETKATIEEAGVNQFGKQLYKATFPDTGFVIPALTKTYITSGWNDTTFVNVSAPIDVNVSFSETESSLIREDLITYENQNYKWLLEVTEIGLVKKRTRNFPNIQEMWCEY